MDILDCVQSARRQLLWPLFITSLPANLKGLLLRIWRAGETLLRLRLLDLHHKQRRDVHVGDARARTDDGMGDLQGIGYGVGAFVAHTRGGVRVAADEDDTAEVVEGVCAPLPGREGVEAVVGVGGAVEGPVPGVQGVLVLEPPLPLVRVGRLRDDLVEVRPVARVGGVVPFVWDGVGGYYDAALADERFSLVEVEEVAEDVVVDQDRVHDGVHVVRPDVRYAEEEHVGLTLHGDELLTMYVPKSLGMYRFGRAGLDAGHAVRGYDGLEDLAGRPPGHHPRRPVVGEKVCLGDGAPLVLGLCHKVEDGREGGVVEGGLDVEDLYGVVQDLPHPVYGAVHSRVGRVHEGAGVPERLRVVVVADGGVGGDAGVDGLVPPVHGDEVYVHVDDEVALGGPAADAYLLPTLRVPDDRVPLFVLCVVVVEPVGVEGGHDPLAQGPPELLLRHAPVQPEGRDEVDVLHALRVSLLEHLLYDELAVVRRPHRRQGAGDVVEDDRKLHAGMEQLVQRLHPHRLEQRPLDGDVRVGERVHGPWGVDHTRPLRQLLVVEAVPRVEHHRRAGLL